MIESVKRKNLDSAVIDLKCYTGAQETTKTIYIIRWKLSTQYSF